MSSYYKPIPYGKTIPLNNPHAFSVSMPRIEDVINYGEDTKVNRDNIKTAYPRILTHPYIKEILSYIKKENSLDDRELFLLPSENSAKILSRISGLNPEIIKYKEYAVAVFPMENKDDIITYYSFMKHCGFMIFSREAEDLLKNFKDIDTFKEDSFKGDSEEQIKSLLKEGYNSDDILISSCGMNAIYAGFEAARKLRKKSNKKLIIQYGWAYSDTLHILNKCTEELIVLEDVSSKKELEELLKNRGDEVAFLYMETVSNPLIQVPDIPGVYKLSKEYDFPILVDNTFATPWSVDISNYCDLVFESLTKYASGTGDIMAGALIKPKDSRFKDSILEEITKYLVPLYPRVQDRLALTIKDYKERVEKVNRNSKTVYEYLKNCDQVKDLFSVYNRDQKPYWDKISRSSDSNCGVISVVFEGDLKDIYNRLDLPKGPSLGSEFPIVMTYTLLAHYKDTKTEEGRDYLNRIGLSPNLLRISVGTDDPKLIINALEKALRG